MRSSPQPRLPSPDISISAVYATAFFAIAFGPGWPLPIAKFLLTAAFKARIPARLHHAHKPTMRLTTVVIGVEVRRSLRFPRLGTPLTNSMRAVAGHPAFVIREHMHPSQSMFAACRPAHSPSIIPGDSEVSADMCLSLPWPRPRHACTLHHVPSRK